jgi:hypothetical protein
VLGFASEIDDLSLAPFAPPYVASDLRCAGDLASSVSDQRNGQRNVDQTPMLALPNGFKGSTRWPRRKVTNPLGGTGWGDELQLHRADRQRRQFGAASV